MHGTLKYLQEAKGSKHFKAFYFIERLIQLSKIDLVVVLHCQYSNVYQYLFVKRYFKKKTKNTKYLKE